MLFDSDRYLIINADDFGANEPTNRAIGELFSAGLITSASMLTVAESSDSACSVAASLNLPVGVHLTLNSDSAEKPWVSNSGAASLGGAKGLWHEQKKLALKAKSKDVTLELEAQYSFMLERGIRPDHADSHSGTLYGINGRLFFFNAFKFCQKYSLPFRFPRRPDFLERQLGRKVPFIVNFLHSAIVGVADKYKVLLPNDIISNPHSIKKIQTYENLRKYYIDEIKNLKQGISEIFLHPSYSLETDTSAENEWLKREYELRLLQSGDLLEEAKRLNICLCSWSDAPFDKSLKSH